MSMNDIKNLQRGWLFGVLPEDILMELYKNSTRVAMPAGKLIFSRGDIAKTVYVVLEGEVSIEILAPDGRSVSLAILRGGEIFGELAVLDDGARSADARALDNATVLRINKSTFLDLTASQPAFSYAIIRELIGRLRTTDTQIENVSLRPLKARLALQLMELANAQEETAERVLKITQSALAERLSATREKVNVNLQHLQRAGAIVLGRGRIEVLDLERLQDIAAE